MSYEGGVVPTDMVRDAMAQAGNTRSVRRSPGHLVGLGKVPDVELG